MHTIKKEIRILLSITGILIVIGLVFIYSSSSIFALEKYGSSAYFVKKQIKGIVLGIIAFLCARFTPVSWIKHLSPFFFLGSLALTALTLQPGFSVTIHGSRRWLSLAGLVFQPSELLKVSLILYVAYLLSKKEYQLSSFAWGYLPFLTILGATAGILLLQPDFGLTVTLATTLFLLLFIAQVNPKHVMVTLATLIPLLVWLIYTKSYRLQRILIFLNPWRDPQGAGFQIIQSLIAIGSGNWMGIGIAQSKQKFFYLPMQHTDFIFSIIAEETGFVGSCALIGLFIIFLLTGLRIAWRLQSSFSVFAVIGCVFMLTLQALINIFVVTGLLPTKGIGLPFISYGLSGLVCNMAMIGLITNMAYHKERV